MKKTIQVHIYRGDNQYVAECLDLPVVTQGKTLDDLVSNLQEALSLQLEGENLENYNITPQPSVWANLELDTEVHAKA